MAAPTTVEPTAPVIRPMRTLGLVSTLHAANHAQAVLMPLIYIAIVDEWGISIGTIGLMVAISSVASGLAQASYASLTRRFTRARLLGLGGVLMGAFQYLMAVAPGIVVFGTGLTGARVGGSPQHPVGNGLLAEQFPVERRGFAISAHIAGGNVGTVLVPLIGAWLIAGVGWRWTLALLGIPIIIIAISILALVRESGTDRAAAMASGSVRQAFATVWRDRDLRWLYLSSVLGGGGRGLGVVNVFIPLYLAQVLDLPASTVALMYAVLVAFSVPAPLVAGWLSDRLGRKPLIVGVYIAGAIAFGVVILAGSNIAALWFGIVLLGLFNFAESPQLQALLADIAPPSIRDASFSAYFTLAFGVGSLWVALYGLIVDALGPDVGLPVVFALMGLAFLLAACAVLPIHADRRATENAAFETGSPTGVTVDTEDSLSR